METKSAIRKELLTRRNTLSNADLQNKSEQIAANLFGTGVYQEATVLLIYMDYKQEVITESIIQDALDKGKLVFLPKVLGETMEFYQIHSLADVQVGYFGIKEPLQREEKKFNYLSEIKRKSTLLMVMPGVGFDSGRNRIGYGKGFYDRYLQDKPDLYKLAIGFECQLIDKIPVEGCDIKSNCLITEHRIL